MRKRILFGLTVCIISITLMAQSSKQIKELQTKRRSALEQINATTQKITETKQTTLSSLNKLNELVEQIKNRKSVISKLNNDILLIEKNQQNIVREIAVLDRSLTEKKNKYATAMRGIYAKRSNYDKMMFVLSAGSLSQSFRRLRYLKEYSEWRKFQAKEIDMKQLELNKKNQELQAIKQKQFRLVRLKEDESRTLQAQESSQKEIVNDLKKKQKSLQAELAQQRRKAEGLNHQIEKLIEEEARKAAEEARKAAAEKNTENKRKSDVKGGYAMNKVEKEVSGSFEKNKGQLPIPVAGSYLLVGRFGTQQHQELKYVKTNNSGVDLQVKPGTEARSVFKGVVSKVFMVPGYNSSVIVRHGNYLTVYSNLKDVFVKAGDSVDTRQSLGRIFTNGDDNRTILHFQIWKETVKLNPEHWLGI